MKKTLTRDDVKVDMTFRIRQNGNPYYVTAVRDGYVCISNRYTGKTDIRNIDLLVSQINKVNQN